MVNLNVVSVAGQGILENMYLTLEPLEADDCHVEIRGLSQKGDLEQQLIIARNLSQGFLEKSYLKNLAVENFKGKKLVLNSKESGVYEGPSFGLSFLTGCLSIGLGIPLKSNHLFTASIIDIKNDPDIPDGLIKIGAVGKLSEKLAAACTKQQRCLFLRCDDETELIEFEQAFWRGEPEYSCYPYVLPEYIPIAAIVAMALDPKILLTKLFESPFGIAFLLLIFYSISDVRDGIKFIPGIGPIIAGLRGKGMLENVESFDKVVSDIGLNISTPEQLIISSVQKCLQNCTDDSLRSEVIKAVISNNPQLPLFASPTKEQQFENDLGTFLQRIDTIPPFFFREWTYVLRICNQLAPDFEIYWTEIKKLIMTSLAKYKDIILYLLDEKKYNEAKSWLVSLYHIDLANNISRLNPEFLQPSKQIIRNLLSNLITIGNKDFIEITKLIAENFELYRIPEALLELKNQEQTKLCLTFSLDKYDDKRKYVSKFIEARPPLKKINDLKLYIEGPEELCLKIDSPVLLYENCIKEPSSFCRLSDITLADSTMSRFPINEAKTVNDLFGNANRIGFIVNSDNKLSSAYTYWLSDLTPWPPAIDSQFLAAVISEYNLNIEPSRIADIGCGTGFLSVVAAHRWPSLKEIHLIDIDPLITATALTNAQIDLRANKLQIITHSQGFDRFREDSFDLLICSPPYLPDRPLPISGIELSTNGTYLLESVVKRGCLLSKEILMAFSSLAWPEFVRAIESVNKSYRSIKVMRREFVPFRIPWLEPIPPDENHSEQAYLQNRKYYQNVLMPRGLIDLDKYDNWPEYFKKFSLKLDRESHIELEILKSDLDLERTLDNIKTDSRGYRFWHEIRVLSLQSA